MTTRNTRAKEQEDTLTKFDKEGYFNIAGKFVDLNYDKIRYSIDRSVVYTHSGLDKLYRSYEYPDPTTSKHCDVEIINEDTFTTAIDLVHKGFNPLVLNLANRFHPGGGYLNGAAAQEESLCRRSSLPLVIDSKEMKKFYPFPLSGGIYSPKILIIKDAEYNLLDEPIEISIVTAAAPRCSRDPKSKDFTTDAVGEKLLNKHLEAELTRTIATILKMGVVQGHDSIVLGAIGCGAFNNPPYHVAKIFKEIIDGYGFTALYKKIVFAILDDHNSGKVGNYKPFVDVFSG
jgi:uncharacterized protein (TIGR02452 family)